MWMPMASPISMVPSRMPSHISVCWARRARGRRNEGTALAMASTPVRAEQPDANARRMSSKPMAWTADTSWWGRATAGCERISPPAMRKPKAWIG